ncbi:hypothetical protein G7Y79_00040g076410 [Physcia stellaris]|nr:hypothetical protein G7Y79_00040g076410 [Physcia stellaris]
MASVQSKSLHLTSQSQTLEIGTKGSGRDEGDRADGEMEDKSLEMGDGGFGGCGDHGKSDLTDGLELTGDDGDGVFDCDALVAALNKLKGTDSRGTRTKKRKKREGQDLKRLHPRTLDKDSPKACNHHKEDFDFPIDWPILENPQDPEQATKKPNAHLPLPPELRPKIYTSILLLPYCLKPNRIPFTSKSRSGTQWPGPSTRHASHYPLDNNYPDPLDLSLLLVSKATYLESYRIFYGANALSFRNCATLLQFLRNIGHTRRQALRDIGFDWVGPGAQAAFRVLATCGALEVVRCTINRLRPPGFEALREVRGLREVVRLPKCVFNEYTGLKGEEWWEVKEGGWREAIELEDWCDVVGAEREEAFEVLRVGMMRPRRGVVEERRVRREGEIGLLGGRLGGVGWGGGGVGVDF